MLLGSGFGEEGYDDEEGFWVSSHSRVCFFEFSLVQKKKALNFPPTVAAVLFMMIS